jgi:hypothetical protein
LELGQQINFPKLGVWFWTISVNINKLFFFSFGKTFWELFCTEYNCRYGSRLASYPLYKLFFMWVDIFLLIDAIHTLVLTSSLLIPFEQTGYHGQLFFMGWLYSTIYRKKRFYDDHYSADMFLPLVIEVFDCLHQ